MTPARALAAALLVSIAACGGSSDPEELPAAFTVMATREAGVADPCITPMGNEQDFTIINADTDAPELRTSGLAVRFCAYGSVDSGWLIECNTAAPASIDEPWSFAIDASMNGGRVTWREYTQPGGPDTFCDDAFTIDAIVAAE